MKSIRIVVVGFGLVGKRHVTAIEQVPGAQVVGLVDSTTDAEDYANQNNLHFSDSLATALNDIQPDGVIVATPTPLHVEHATLCVDHGCPVLIEKPLADQVESARTLVQHAQSKSVPILVGHHRRHNPLIQKAHQIIKEGRLGDIRSLHAQCWFYKPDHYFEEAPWRTKTGAGPISVNLAHDIDLIRYLCGEVTTVTALQSPSSRGFENEEVAAAVLAFENGAVGTVSVSDGIVAPWSWELTSGEYPVYPKTAESCYLLGGTRGSLSIPDLKLWHQGGDADWWEEIKNTTHEYASSDQIVQFVRVINGEEAPLVSGLEGLKTLQVIQAIQKSACSSSMIRIESV